jgi:hypothetical protein
MSDSFVNLPLDKLKNRENIVSRVERLEGKTGARPSATAVSLGEIAGQTGTLQVDGSIVVIDRATGLSIVTIDSDGVFMQNSANGWFNFEDAAGNRGTINIAADPSNDLEFVNIAESPAGLISFFLKIGGVSTPVFRLTTTRTYFNPNAEDVDFSVGSAGNANFFVIDAGAETVMVDGSLTVTTGDVNVNSGSVNVSAGYISLAASSGYDLLYGALEAHEGFFPVSETWTRTGTHSFTVPSDRESRYRKGTKLAYTDAGVNEYGVVGSSVFVTTDNATTVTLIPNTDYGMSTDTIADPHVSYADNPLDFPDWFNFDAAPSGFSAVPASPSYRWRTSGRCIFISYGEPNNGTSNATTFTATVPVAPVNAVTGVAGTLVDNGTVRTVAGRVTIGAGSTTMIFRTDMASGAWTNANGKRGVAALFYEY